jgi:hypothetical protein
VTPHWGMIPEIENLGHYLSVNVTPKLTVLILFFVFYPYKGADLQ